MGQNFLEILNQYNNHEVIIKNGSTLLGHTESPGIWSLDKSSADDPEYSNAAEDPG